MGNVEVTHMHSRGSYPAQTLQLKGQAHLLALLTHLHACCPCLAKCRAELLLVLLYCKKMGLAGLAKVW